MVSQKFLKCFRCTVSEILRGVSTVLLICGGVFFIAALFGIGGDFSPTYRDAYLSLIGGVAARLVWFVVDIVLFLFGEKLEKKEGA